MTNLEKVFADLSDEALLGRFCSGALTDEAKVLAKAEITQRGLSLPQQPDSDEEFQESPSEDLVAVVRDVLPVEARVIQGLFEAEGIYAFVADENLMNALPIWAHASRGGGARVLVSASRVDAAREILLARKNGAYDLEDEDSN
jgi:hypothetical protein